MLVFQGVDQLVEHDWAVALVVLSLDQIEGARVRLVERGGRARHEVAEHVIEVGALLDHAKTPT